MADPVTAAATAHWVHNLDPVALYLPWGIELRWYGVSYLAGILCGWMLLSRWAKRQRLPMPAEHIGDFIVTVAIGMLLGGRLGYALLYEPSLFWTTSSTLPYWKLLAVHQGGMASHGGIAGVAIATLWWAWRKKQSSLALGDALAAVGPLGIACGRMANFINGELWGKPWDGSWAVVFRDAVPAVPRHPSQLYAMFLEGLLVFAILIPLHARHRRPGLTLGLFFVLYSIGRFVGEFFREPDKGQPGFDVDHPAILGFMSKGQLYTIPVLIIGAVLIWQAWKRASRPEAYAVTPTKS
ncbi:MAG: prolipoprotein diacylglyceryl transferase [Planctomycetota bacterium]